MISYALKFTILSHKLICMNKLIVLLLISVTTSIGMSAQITTPYSQEAVSSEFSTYYTELQSFVSKLENVPSNFNPQSLNDYDEYLGENASISIQNFHNAYGDLIAYLQDYETYHGSGSVQSFFDTQLDDVEEMPDCFDTWYATEVQLTVTAVLCCYTGVGCPLCLVSGAIASTVNMGVYYECMKQYDDNP